LKPNLPNSIRIAYVVIGLILLAAPLAATLDLWIRIGAVVVGLLAIITGATGW